MTVQIRDRILELRRVPAAELQANPANWRRHPDRQRKALRSMLESVGYAGAVLARVDADGRLVLIDGHLRAETTPDAQIPVLVLDVDETEAAQLLATLDPLAAMAETDAGALAELLETISISDADLEAFLRKTAGLPAVVGHTPPDEVPAVPDQATTQTGDVWALGGHRLICGDSTDPTVMARLMEGSPPAALFCTDPPYGVNYTGKRPSRSADPADRDSGKDWSADFHDDRTSDWPVFLRAFTEACMPHLAEDAAWYLWHAHRWAGAIADLWVDLGVLPHQQIIWSKPAAMFSTAYFNWQHEPCLFGWREGHRPDWVDQQLAAHTTSVWQLSYDGGAKKQQTEHPTQKPVELFALPMRIHTHPSAVCLEPFSGSGSQIIAAEAGGRVCMAVEREPRFCDVAVARWEAFTGRTAELVRG